jgi:Surfeit locus protein 6
MKLAKGDKVLDNPQLLRKSVKKESKERAKKAAAWQARNQATATKQAAQQQKCGPPCVGSAD